MRQVWRSSVLPPPSYASHPPPALSTVPPFSPAPSCPYPSRHTPSPHQTPCVVCHPYLTTATPMPSSFPARMRRTYPGLFRRLTRLPVNKPRLSPKAMQGDSATGSESSGRRERAAEAQGGRAETAWSHVEHWMWPLFTDRWGPFRERLGLHPCPFHEEEQTMEPLERRTSKEGARLSVPGTGARGALRAVDPAQLPLVLYLFSPLVVDASPFWPDCVRVCGYLFPASTPTPTTTTTSPATSAQSKSGGEPGPACSVGNTQRQRLAQSSIDQLHKTGFDSNLARVSDQPEHGINVDVDDKARCRGSTERGDAPGLPPDVETFLSAREDRAIYVGFGSMWSMCSPGYRLAFALRVLLLGARQAGSRCMVHLPPAREEARAGKAGFEGAQVGDGNRLAELDSAMKWVLGEFTASAAQDELLVNRAWVEMTRKWPACAACCQQRVPGRICPCTDVRSGQMRVFCLRRFLFGVRLLTSQVISLKLLRRYPPFRPA